MIKAGLVFGLLLFIGGAPLARAEDSNSCPIDRSTHSLKSGIQPAKVDIPSHSKIRNSFSGLLYDAPGRNCVILFMHGGTCVTPPESNSLSSPRSALAPPDFVASLIERSQCSVLVLNYNENFKWKTNLENKIYGMSKAYYEEFERIRAQECEDATSTVLDDISNLITKLPSVLPSAAGKPIHIIGHSYGAYLANMLTTYPAAEKVASFVSYAGAWDIKSDLATYKMKNLVYSEKFNPIERKPVGKPKLLLIHAKNDGSVPYSQTDVFKSWSKSQQYRSEYELFEDAQHWVECDARPELHQKLMDGVIDFLSDGKQPLQLVERGPEVVEPSCQKEESRMPTAIQNLQSTANEILRMTSP